MISMVESVVERGANTTTERRYYLCSAKLDAATFARAVRAHWGVENGLHWVLDVVFDDDLNWLRTGHGAENMAIVQPHGAQPHARHHGQGQPQGAPEKGCLELELPRQKSPEVEGGVVFSSTINSVRQI